MNQAPVNQVPVTIMYHNSNVHYHCAGPKAIVGAGPKAVVGAQPSLVVIAKLQGKRYLLLINRKSPRGPQYKELYNKDFLISWTFSVNEHNLTFEWGQESESVIKKRALVFNNQIDLWRFATAFYEARRDIEELKTSLKMTILVVQDSIMSHYAGHKVAQNQILASAYMSSERLEAMTMAAVCGTKYEDTTDAAVEVEASTGGDNRSLLMKTIESLMIRA